MEWDIDKTTLKLFRYIYRRSKRGVVQREIYIKYGDYVSKIGLPLLAQDKYLMARDKNNKYVPFVGTDNMDTSLDYRWFTAARANVLIEKENKEFWRWMVPLVFSALALGISIINMIKAFNTPASQEPIQIVLTTLAPTTMPSISPTITQSLAPSTIPSILPTIVPSLPPIPTLPPIFPFIP